MAVRTHKKNAVILTHDERRAFQQLIDNRRLPMRPLLRLQVLLLADQSPAGMGLTDAEIRNRTKFSIRSIEWIRATYCNSGVTELTSWRGKPTLVPPTSIPAATPIEPA